MPLPPAELEPLLRLALVQGVGPGRLAQLIASFGSADRVLLTRKSELRAVQGIGEEVANRIRSAGAPAAKRGCRAAMDHLLALGASVITPEDPYYPQAFVHLADPPYLLFTVGDIEVLKTRAIAVVGTRTPTSYGRDAAGRLSRELVLMGFTIVSGMARGIDSAAHFGALEADGPTIGVLGHGIEQIYPPENRKLYQRVRESGLLLTEYPPGETPRAGNFPRRNRLITALAEAVLVVEMRHQSGAQHSVTYALEQGKEVMAVPGPIYSPTSAGTNQLIKDGARLVTSASDVLEELRGVGAATMRVTTTPSRSAAAAVAHELPSPSEPALALLTEPESRMLAALSVRPAHIDELLSDAGFSARDALATLLELEIRGLVASLPGKRFVRATDEH